MITGQEEERCGSNHLLKKQEGAPRPDWGPGLGDLAEDAGCTGKLTSEQRDLSGEGGLSRSGALLSLGWLNHSWEEPRLQPPEGLSSSKSC